MDDKQNALTREQLRMIRKASGVIFRYHSGRSTFEAFKQNTKTLHDDWRIEIECPHQYLAYGENSRDLTDAFEYIQSAQYCDEWMTVAQLLRAGDEISIKWVADGHQTLSLQSAGFHADSVKLVVRRGEKVLTFPVATRVTIDGSTARMINAKTWRAAA